MNRFRDALELSEEAFEVWIEKYRPVTMDQVIGRTVAILNGAKQKTSLTGFRPPEQ